MAATLTQHYLELKAKLEADRPYISDYFASGYYNERLGKDLFLTDIFDMFLDTVDDAIRHFESHRLSPEVANALQEFQELTDRIIILYDYYPIAEKCERIRSEELRKELDDKAREARYFGNVLRNN